MHAVERHDARGVGDDYRLDDHDVLRAELDDADDLVDLVDLLNLLDFLDFLLNLDLNLNLKLNFTPTEGRGLVLEQHDPEHVEHHPGAERLQPG